MQKLPLRSRNANAIDTSLLLDVMNAQFDDVNHAKTLNKYLITCKFALCQQRWA